MKIKDVLKKFKENGYDIVEKVRHSNSILLKGNGVVIMIIGNKTKKYDVYKNEIRAESERTFDKWSTAYYYAVYPQNENRLEKIISEIKVLDDDYHVERSDKFLKFNCIQGE